MRKITLKAIRGDESGTEVAEVSEGKLMAVVIKSNDMDHDTLRRMKDVLDEKFGKDVILVCVGQNDSIEFYEEE